MKILTIDTSTTTWSVALSCGEEVIAEHLVSRGGKLSACLLDAVDLLLRSSGLTVADMEGFGVAIGPGAFTGLRIGIATVKGLAMAAGKPVAGFSSLAMLAMNLPWASHQICPLFDARKKEVYAGLYECKALPRALAPDCVVTPEVFLARVDGPAIFVGEGAVRYRDLITDRLGQRAMFAPFPADLPRASAGALLALQAFSTGGAIHPAQLLPAYIRPSEAELALIARQVS